MEIRCGIDFHRNSPDNFATPVGSLTAGRPSRETTTNGSSPSRTLTGQTPSAPGRGTQDSSNTSTSAFHEPPSLFANNSSREAQKQTGVDASLNSLGQSAFGA